MNRNMSKLLMAALATSAIVVPVSGASAATNVESGVYFTGTSEFYTFAQLDNLNIQKINELFSIGNNYGEIFIYMEGSGVATLAQAEATSFIDAAKKNGYEDAPENIIPSGTYKGEGDFSIDIENPNDRLKVGSVSAINGAVTVTLLEAVEAVTPTDFKVTQSIDGAEATTVTPSKAELAEDGVTVTLTVPTVAATTTAQSVVYTVNGKAATAFSVDAKATEAVSLEIQNATELQAATLTADGKTVMQVKAVVKDKDGKVATDFEGTAQFVSKLGYKAAQTETTFDKGVATFNVQLENSKVDVNDEIRVRISKHDDVKFIGQETAPLALTYKANQTDGGIGQITTYSIDRIQSADLADRVTIYVGGVHEAHIDYVEQAIIEQVKLYNKANAFGTDNQIDIVGFEGEPTKSGNGYAFTALVDLPAFNSKGVSENLYASNPNILIDNQYNYWSVLAGDNIVRLNEKVPSLDNKFMLVDGKVPNFMNVLPSKNDGEFLPDDTLLAKFNEPVNRKTAENPENWVLNGTRLSTNDVEYIRVLDIASQEDAAGKELLGYTAIEDSKERNTVLIKLKPSVARTLLKDGNNLLQAKSIADWAGMYDLSDNNKISTQDFTFEYTVPETVVGVDLTKESPEQYVVQLKSTLFLDKDAKEELDLSVHKENLKLTISSTGLAEDDAKYWNVPVTDYKITKSPTGKYYVLELTKDWTKILQEPKTYHGATVTLSIADAYDVYGVQQAGSFTAKADELQPINSEGVVVPEDTTSPSILESEILDLQEGKTLSAHVRIKMSEPVQLFDRDTDKEVVPGLTPSVKQENGDGVPVPTFEYVKVSEGGLVSKGEKVEGEIVNIETLHDQTFTVKPSKNQKLEAGEWKLVVRSISDDVGNTMATEEIPLTVAGEVIKSEDNTVEPYVVWAYADDNKENEDGSVNDYVYVAYSREMSTEALRAATYNINGKQVNQDADITSTFVEVYRQNEDPSNPNYNNIYGDGLDKDGKTIARSKDNPQYRLQVVKIQLPEDFIIGGDDLADGGKEVGGKDVTNKHNVLTIPATLAATDDGNDLTDDKLKFTNNGGQNQFQLSFEGYNKLTNSKELPKFAKNFEYATVVDFLKLLEGGKVVDTGALKSAIEDAEEVSSKAVVGNEVGQYPADAKATFEEAIAKAKTVFENPDASQKEVNDAEAELAEAVKVFEESVNEDKGGETVTLSELVTDETKVSFQVILGTNGVIRIDKTLLAEEFKDASEIYAVVAGEEYIFTAGTDNAGVEYISTRFKTNLGSSDAVKSATTFKVK